MILSIIGPPASGKGTQADLLVEKLKLQHVSTGQILRNMQKTMPKLKKIMNSGLIVPDDITMKGLFKYLEEKDVGDDFILDGSPRTLYQYNEINKWLRHKGKKIDFVVLIDISKDMAIKRISSRRQDRKTGKFYNLITDPPPESVKKSNLYIRKDDKPEVVEERFDEYRKLTIPVVEAAKKDNILVKIDGEQPINEVFADIMARLKTKKG